MKSANAVVAVTAIAAETGAIALAPIVLSVLVAMRVSKTLEGVR